MGSLKNRPRTEIFAPPASLPILIVDDEVICRDILRLRLEDWGYDCLEANNGKTALEIIRTSSIGFIITDFHMPYLNGCELLEQLSVNDGTSPPAVLMTGNLSDQIQQWALQAGALTVLEKPFDENTLHGVLHRWAPIPQPCQGTQPLSSVFHAPGPQGPSRQHALNPKDLNTKQAFS